MAGFFFIFIFIFLFLFLFIVPLYFCCDTIVPANASTLVGLAEVSVRHPSSSTLANWNDKGVVGTCWVYSMTGLIGALGLLCRSIAVMGKTSFGHHDYRDIR